MILRRHRLLFFARFEFAWKAIAIRSHTLVSLSFSLSLSLSLCSIIGYSVILQKAHSLYNKNYIQR